MSCLHPHHEHPPRRQFLKKGFVFLGAVASGSPVASKTAQAEGAPRSATTGAAHVHPPAALHKSDLRKERGEPYRVFDAHLHCPSESGQVWQWYPVTKSFAEFNTYLEKTGVERGIINNVRCQLAKTPRDFIEGNREVARYVEKYCPRR